MADQMNKYLLHGKSMALMITQATKWHIDRLKVHLPHVSVIPSQIVIPSQTFMT